MNFPDIPEYVAGYFNFIIDFAISPTKASTPYKGSDKIDKDLLAYAAIGTFLTWLTIVLLKKIGQYYRDKSHLMDFVENVDQDAIPFIVLPCIISISLLIHLIVRIIFRFNTEARNLSPSLINCKNTINGALAFFSFGPFVITFFFLVTMSIAYNLPRNTHKWVLIPLILPISIFAVWVIFFRFHSSITSMQHDELKKPYTQAIIACAGTCMVLFATVNWIADAY